MGCLFCKKKYKIKKEIFVKHSLPDNRFIGFSKSQRIGESVPEDVQAIVNEKVNDRGKRLGICQVCSAIYSFLGTRRCRICGCFLAIKASLPNTRCPLRKW
jgi:hypothetical protein